MEDPIPNKDHEFNAKVRNILMQPKEKIVLYIYMPCIGASDVALLARI